MEGITILDRTRVLDFAQQAGGVVARAEALDGGAAFEIACDYMVGCDGGGSPTRKAIGARFEGDAVVSRVQSTLIRAPSLLGMFKAKPAWGTFSLNPRRAGNMYAIDGKELWLIHNYMRPEEPDFESVDRDACIRADPRRRAGVRIQRGQQGGLVRPPPGRRQVPRPPRLHLRRRRAYLGADGGLRHECRHRRRHEPGLDARRRAAGLGAAGACSTPTRPSACRSPSRSAAMPWGTSSSSPRSAAPCRADIEAPGPAGDAVRARVGARRL